MNVCLKTIYMHKIQHKYGSIQVIICKGFINEKNNIIWDL